MAIDVPASLELEAIVVLKVRVVDVVVELVAARFGQERVLGCSGAARIAEKKRSAEARVGIGTIVDVRRKSVESVKYGMAGGPKSPKLRRERKNLLVRKGKC